MLTNYDLMQFEKFGHLPALTPPTPTTQMDTPENYLKIASAQLWPYLEANSPGALVPPQIQRKEERARWYELTNKALELVEERRQYGSDIINDMTLEAEHADAHTKEVEQQLTGLMAAVSALRRMATGSAPHCINVDTIDRILGKCLSPLPC